VQGVAVAIAVNVETESAAKSVFVGLMHCLKTKPPSSCVGNKTDATSGMSGSRRLSATMATCDAVMVNTVEPP
jgi:hypothetical protein